MVRSENIEAKLAFLRGVLGKLDRFRAMPPTQIFSNSDLTAALERYLFLVTQAAIDAIEMYCKLKKLGRPESMTEAVRLLHTGGIIDQSLTEKMVRMVGFRNYLSHGYEHIDQKILTDVLTIHLNDLDELAKILEGGTYSE